MVQPKYPTNKQIFLNEDNISFYLLGAYMTDGNVFTKKRNKSFSIASKDLEWLESIRDLISPTRPIQLNSKSNCYSLKSSDKEVMDWLISYGCIPAKSKILKIKKEIPAPYRADFFRGALDGDGSISICPYKKIKGGKEYSYTKVSVYICGSSEEFLKQVQDLIPSGIKSYIYKQKERISIVNGKRVAPTCDFFKLTINDSYAKKLLIWAYYPDHKISLNRKFLKTKEI